MSWRKRTKKVTSMKTRKRDIRKTRPKTDRLVRDSVQRLVGWGTRVHMAAGIPICCMKPDYRDCLDRVMDEWKKHKVAMRQTMGKNYRPGEYGFAYWLLRWSGLVQPSSTNR